MRDLEKLKTEVFKRRPVLKKIYRQSGHLSLFDYVNSWKAESGELDRQFIKILESLLNKQLPKAETKKIIGRLKFFSLVSTVDHHGILNHPFFINSNLLFSFYNSYKYLLCLSTSGVSLNNSSWPACLIYHQQGKQQRYSIFSDKDKNLPVFSHRAYRKSDIHQFLEKLQGDKLKVLAKQIFLDRRVLKCKNFSDQASLISYKLWQKIFPKAPKVVYLPLEDLASEVIAGIISKDKRHVLHEALFARKGPELLEKYFLGLQGAFGPKGRGSFLFWAIDKAGRRARLERRGLKIENDEMGIGISLNPKSIAGALKRRKIYPTSLLCFLVLLYYGLTCLGGFNQTNWLTDIKKRFVKLLKEQKNLKLAKKIGRAVTDNFAESNLAFLTHQKKLIKASGVDIFLEGKNMYAKYRNLSKSTKLKESIETLLPEMYRIVVPEEKRRDVLLKITDEQIAKANGLEKQIIEIIK
ncbi:MAG: hypothetical protein COT92_03690 [Candidatus Doudnabacteria bacterium CG10_big_fil_rev_8_21_14_0_10_42_18]|uniref:Uncharacterized protein n=1 Tax=Candidatus Doudnabacteria bacterium CG10_big_fil_rev_8_21_14_0_10_42_18 TaxID=1974552 RepID=A0A2H0VA02_9BACT|nr:MAG: hypothetical protein COT92_03690 [Candidatus Doudnabacteria bacterium CG10_big_fil_rev_8_21_14_0_10_42_18]